MECELEDIAAGAAVGQLCAASYFDTIGTSDNLAFKARLAKLYGADRRVSSVFAGAYTAVKLCIEAILAAGSDEPQAVRRQLHAASWPTLLGPLAIDPETNHAALPSISAASTATTASTSSPRAPRSPPIPILPAAVF